MGRPWSILQHSYTCGRSKSLWVSKDNSESTYLVGLVSCWPCVFVLLKIRERVICLENFKMASLIAYGYTCNLAIPMLMSIYRGINGIIVARKAFPFSHFSWVIFLIYSLLITSWPMMCCNLPILVLWWCATRAPNQSATTLVMLTNLFMKGKSLTWGFLC